MKNKLLITILLIVVAVVCVFYYFKQNNKLPEEGVIQQNQENISQNKGKMVTDDFQIDIPEGWKNVPEPSMGVSAMAVNSSEGTDDPAIELINFKSYVAVSYDTLNGRNLAGYMQDVKNGLTQLVPEKVFFGDENDTVINGMNARKLELEMIQQGADFKVLIVAVEGNNGDVWTISFNTAKSNWDSYKEEFLSVVDSFTLK